MAHIEREYTSKLDCNRIKKGRRERERERQAITIASVNRIEKKERKRTTTTENNIPVHTISN